jgi:hypothetical protein
MLVGIAMAANKQATIQTVASLVHDGSIMFVFGLILVAAGLALVLSHNIWSGGVPTVLVTVVGWLTLLKGLAFLFMPPPASLGFFVWGAGYERLFYFDTAVVTILGAYLTYAGFRSK